MAKLFFTLTGILLAAQLCYATPPTEPVISAIRASNADKLSEFFDSNVDLKILEKENIFSKSQAGIIVKDFFATYKVTALMVNHEGGPENARFTICNIITNSGKFRVYFLYKTINTKIIIQKFRVEKDE